MHIDVKALKKAMIDADINTLGELVDKSGVYISTVSEILNESRTPSYDTIVKLAKALNLDSEAVGRIFFAPVLT